MISRRKFCSEMAALTLATWSHRALAENTSASKPAARLHDADSVKRRMIEAGGPLGWRIGAGLNGFMSSEKVHKQSYPIWEVLEFCEKEGFDGIELVQGWPMGNYPSVADTRKVDALRRLYDRYHLKIYTI